MGFVQCTSDPCIYVKEEFGEIFIIAVYIYVDDILLAGKTDQQINEVKQALAEMKDIGELHHFLGVKVVQNPDVKEVWIGQEAFTKSMLEKFGMESSKPVSTPVNSGTKLKRTTKGGEQVDPVYYQSAVGHLL